jgi:Bromodomain
LQIKQLIERLSAQDKYYIFQDPVED